MLGTSTYGSTTYAGTTAGNKVFHIEMSETAVAVPQIKIKKLFKISIENNSIAIAEIQNPAIKVVEITATAKGNTSINQVKRFERNLSVEAPARPKIISDVYEYVYLPLEVNAEAQPKIEQLKYITKDLIVSAQAQPSLDFKIRFLQSITSETQSETQIENKKFVYKKMIAEAKANTTLKKKSSFFRTLEVRSRGVVENDYDYGVIDKYPENEVNYNKKYENN